VSVKVWKSVSYGAKKCLLSDAPAGRPLKASDSNVSRITLINV